MMCTCDEEFGRRFLSYQLAFGTELNTQKNVRVTAGFQPGICSECKGLPAESAPAAEGFGRTSKIKRYYWREIFFEEMRRKGDWDELNKEAPVEERRSAHQAIEQSVLANIKTLHATKPKYVFDETSQSAILDRYKVEVVDIRANYAPNPQKGAVIAFEDEVLSPEEFVSRIYIADGWSVMRLESVPLHVLFGTMMWLLIQDPADPQGQIVGFGDRAAYEATGDKPPIWMQLPSDFGTPAYYLRRKRATKRHFDLLLADREELLWLFDYWLEPSASLRNYLWAHRSEDIDRARRLIEILRPSEILTVLRYLLEDYWGRYLGWPDLVLWRANETTLIEVKSSGDKISEDQKIWIAGNSNTLKLPFRVVKIHRANGSRHK